MTRVGIGYGNDGDAHALGRAAAAMALRDGAVTRPALVMAFCTCRTDPVRFLAGLREMVGEAPPVIGGSSLGVITAAALSYEGYPATVAVVASDSLGFAVSAAGNLDRDETAAGHAMAEGLPLSPEDRLLLLFYDSIRVPAGSSSPPVLSWSAPLLAGVAKRLPESVPVIGAGLVSGFEFGPTVQFDGRRVVSQHAVGCLVSGRCHVDHVIMHGCIPADGIYRRITRMERDVVHELDGTPITELIDTLYGNPDWRQERPVISNLTLGVDCGERFGPPLEAKYANRLLTGVTPAGDGVGMFEGDLEVGQEVLFMVRDNRMMLQSVIDNTPALLEQVRAAGRRPFLALYIDCGGRTAALSLTDREEAAVVQEVLREAGVPLLGFYSGVEIAPLLGRSRGLDWTGVLVILSEET